MTKCSKNRKSIFFIAAYERLQDYFLILTFIWNSDSIVSPKLSHEDN